MHHCNLCCVGFLSGKVAGGRHIGRFWAWKERERTNRAVHRRERLDNGGLAILRFAEIPTTSRRSDIAAITCCSWLVWSLQKLSLRTSTKVEADVQIRAMWYEFRVTINEVRETLFRTERRTGFSCLRLLKVWKRRSIYTQLYTQIHNKIRKRVGQMRTWIQRRK